MLLTNLRIHWKIIILSFGLILFSLLIGGIILFGRLLHGEDSRTGQKLLLVARTAAELPTVRRGVNAPDRLTAIDPIVDRIRIINDVTYIVVLDMDKTRLSHPIDAMIGTKLDSSDADPAFAEQSYVTKVQGEQGTAMRAYVPIMDTEHHQVGVVMAGQLLPGLWATLMSQRGYTAITLLISLVFGAWGSWLLARHIKKQMYNLEPQQIARLLSEREASFQAMHEGAIAIDRSMRITIFNERAKQIFGIEGDVAGLPIFEVIPDSRLPEVLNRKDPIYNQELLIGGTLIWSNRFPIKENGAIIGALAIFQDRTEVTRMAEELTGVKAFVDALRVQNHEYMNKLHTIAGLLQLGQKDKALDYLFEVSEQQEEATKFLTSRIHDDSLSGLLLSKISRGRELGVDVRIDEHSRLDRFPPFLDHHDFVLLLGNLIENAFDALAGVEVPDKEVFVSLMQDEEALSLLVEDNGSGMTEEVRQRMLERGFSTKAGEGRGIGLTLVGQIIAKGGGELKCESEPGHGTSMLITFPMKDQNNTAPEGR